MPPGIISNQKKEKKYKFVELLMPALSKIMSFINNKIIIL